LSMFLQFNRYVAVSVICFFLFVCGCGANKLHTTLWALDLVAFLV
jgi:hypothetical protein